MLAQLSLGTNHQRFPVYAITVAVFGILLAPGARAQMNYLITISPTGDDSKPQLSVTASGHSSGTCPHPTPNARKLHVCPNDTVQWTIDPTIASYQIYVFHEEPILLKGTTPTQSFDISDTGITMDGGTITSDGSLVGWHEYYIAVFDKKAKRLYVEDPKVIIGTGTFQDEVKAIRAKCGDQEKLVTEDKEKEKARAICKDIEKVLNQLQPQK